MAAIDGTSCGLVGWKSRQLLRRYGGAELSDGRRGERQPFSLGDRP